MGDINEEWEIEEEDSLYPVETKSNVSWIMDKGLNLGKKIVITGFLISSAPLVLPPLVVISALGFAFSLPSGILLSSYACTEKLMSKLLPIADDEYYYWEKGIENNVEGHYNVEEEKGNGSTMGYDYKEEDFGKHLETRGIEEEPLTKTKRAKLEQTSDNDRVSVTEEQIPMETKGVEEKIDRPTFETEIKGNIQETENKKEVDPHTSREATQEAEAQRKSIPVEGNSVEEDVGVTVVTEKTIVNDNEPSKKAAKKRKGNKKQDEKVARSTKDIPKKAPQDTAEIPSSEEVHESKQAGSKTRRRKDTGKA